MEWARGLELKVVMPGNEREAGGQCSHTGPAGPAAGTLVGALSLSQCRTDKPAQNIAVILTHSEKWFLTWWVSTKPGISLPVLTIQGHCYLEGYIICPRRKHIPSLLFGGQLSWHHELIGRFGYVVSFLWTTGSGVWMAPWLAEQQGDKYKKRWLIDGHGTKT